MKVILILILQQPMEQQFDNINDIVDNFDSFCDSFESRAAEAFLRGDQNDGRVTRKSEEIGVFRIVIGTPIWLLRFPIVA